MLTPQMRLVALGGGTALVSKFAFGRSWQMSAVIGLAAIAAWTILTLDEKDTVI